MNLAVEAPKRHSRAIAGHDLPPASRDITGTPEGVNAVVAGDRMRGEIQGLGAIEVRVTA